MDIKLIKKGFTKVNLSGQKLVIIQVNYDYKNGSTNKILDILVDIDGSEHWLNDASFYNFIEN
tara:strand:+ start:1354 stop:1542 length:189 start_codon:yes stop_codon:yes gene_type:complete